MIPRAAVALCAAGALCHGGIIHGIVLEKATSRPLARTRVQLQSVAAGGGRAKLAEALTDRSGQFWFPSLADGYYFLVARRKGFLDLSYGQKRPAGPGMVIEVKGESVTFAEMPMRHLGAITGRLVDENQVGVMEANVYAYHANLPLRVAANVKTDDRGVFRLYGLTPGKYWVRSGPVELEDGSGMLPTFHPGVPETKEARIFAVEADGEIGEAYFQPIPGRLFKLTGQVRCPYGATNVKITLSSDTGRKEAVANCPFGGYSFDQLAPASYEILAEAMPPSIEAAYWQQMALDREADVRLVPVSLPTFRVDPQANKKADPNAARITLRRVDPAGEGPTTQPGRYVLPGIWEVFVAPAAQYAFTRLAIPPWASRVSTGEGLDAPRAGVDNAARLGAEAVLGPGASVNGVVKKQGHEWPGAPVYLLAPDPNLRRLIHGILQVTTDAQGKFSFVSLPPGGYLLISSYDLDEITKDTLEAARAKAVVLAEGRTETVTLDLYEVQ